MSARHPLLAVPNVSEGRDRAAIDAVAEAFVADGAARLLDVHSDPDHHRAVFTLAGESGGLWRALLAGFRQALACIDVVKARPPHQIGQHPHVGAVDVLPLVYLSQDARGAACAEALVLAEEVGEQLDVPVFLYGALAGGRTRAEVRRGNLPELARRIAAGEIVTDFGPARIHPTAGATLVAAREPLVAFNLELAPPATVVEARAIAAAIREGGPDGLPGLRAIGVQLTGSRTTPQAQEADGTVAGERSAAGAHTAAAEAAVAQVSMNVEQPLELPLAQIVAAVRRHAEVAGAELVGLAPQAALAGFPDDVPMPDFDPMAHVIENALGF